VKGLGEAAKAELSLGECEDFEMLRQGGCITISEEFDDGFVTKIVIIS
jgi:hypothetical protein